jgi:predicted AlkP superfamily pyrophosphatase or phosphodiesterase
MFRAAQHRDPTFQSASVTSLFRATALLVLTAAGAPAQMPTARPPAPAAAPAPTLVLFLTVDQLRPDYLTRFRSQLTGGLKRLYEGGAVFTNAHHDHATAETAPGHASVMSGRFPQHTGIVRNNAGVGDAQAPLIGSGAAGASPFRFRGGVLTDWLRTKDPRTRALSVARKDRGAILPLGRAKQHVFWYGLDGRFTTSRYYADTLPTWVNQFNARRPLAQYAGREWTLLLPESAYAEPDSVPVESRGVDFTFPHRLTADTTRLFGDVADYPWMDEQTLALALAGLEALGLGRGPQTDVLAVSLSTTDAIGHRYGPDSREVHDQVLRLDRSLGAFFDSLYKVVDSTRVVVALTADHGVTRYPQLRFAGTDPARGRAEVRPLLRRYAQRMQARGVDSSALDFEFGMVAIDRAAFARARVNADSTLRAFLADMRRVPGILRADLRTSLAAKAAAGDKIARRWVHALPSDLTVAAVVTIKPDHYWATSVNATHGSPHDADTHVPVIFYGPPFRRGRYTGFVRTVDIAPTLARVTGTLPTEPLDGVVLTRALR